jgi:predicted CoA-binding protein
MESTFRSWYQEKMLATPELVAEANRIDEILDAIKTIAIVGISTNKTRDSHFVGRYLKNAGYTVIPVNPTATEILDETCYPDLKSIPVAVDAVDIFRKPSDVPGVVEEALALNPQPKVIWLQLGTGTHDALKERAEAQGVALLQNRCMKVDHQFLKRPEQG